MEITNEVLVEKINEAMMEYPEKVTEYRSGKAGLLGMFVGLVMIKTNGKSDPKTLNYLTKKMLDGNK